MVDISSGDKKINITVSTSGNKASVNATPDTAMYYSNKSREWAISNNIVDNEDYSSKYYANESKKQAETVKNKITEVNNAVAEGITNIINQENISVDNVNTAGGTQVNLAKEQAAIATTQAGIATAKTSEVVESGNNAINAITEQETTSKNNIETKGAEQITLIQNEGATQIANVQSTGFYMRDDKLYFINSQGEETEFKSGGSGLEIGDISTSLYVDESLNKRRYLNGQIIENNKIHKNIIDFLIELKNTNPELFTTESNWQAEAGLSVFGQVGKFVFNYDTDGETILSARLPRVINIQGVQGSSGLGALVRESLPNITGEINAGTSEYGIFWAGSNYNASGAFVLSDFNGKQSTGSEAKKAPKKVNIDASRSNSTYQDNAPVQQEAVQYRYFIQINTGSERKEDVLSTLKQNTPYSLFESKYSDHQLNNASWLRSNGQFNPKTVYVKAYEALQVEYNSEIAIAETVDLPSGTSYVKQGLSVKLSTEDYDDYDFVLNTTDETFRLPLKTKLASGKAVVGNGMTLGFTDGTINAGVTIVNNDEVRLQKKAYGTNIGTVSSASYPASPNFSCYGVTTDPTKSGIELSDSGLYLYFYVGETVQNANLIDAGRIGEQLANKTDMLQASGAGMPSSKYINLTLGESGTKYTAPANGYVYIYRTGLSDGNATHIAVIGSIGSKSVAVTGSLTTQNFLPVRKGQSFSVSYSGSTTSFTFRFTYAEGEV